MAESKSAKYQRAFRERMRRQGLVSKLVYVRPEYSALLARVEKALQQPAAHIVIKNGHRGDQPAMGSTKWTTTSLFEALKGSELVSGGQATLELIEGVEPTINITMHEFGDLPIQVSVSGEQLFCSTQLWGEDQVADPAAFNESLLLLNPINPLSNFGLIQQPDGRRVYIVFGELSASSLLEHVVEEVEILAQNTLEAAEAFAGQLVK